MLSAQKADVYTDFSGLAKLKAQARKDSPEAVKEVAKQFESIFLNNVLKSMREAKLADGALDNEQSKFYNDMYDQQLAVHLSGSPGVGLADLIAKQLSPDKNKHQKQELDDYLKTSSGLSRSGTEPVHALSRQNRGIGDSRFQASPYSQDSNPFEPMNEVPIHTDNGAPIQSSEDFVRRLQPYAEQAGRELGVEPKVILAQAALESGWGRSVIRNGSGNNSYNLFNIKADKAWQGRQAQVATLEFDQGIPKKVNAGFRVYDSFADSFRDYVDFIKSNPRYGHALKKAGNAEQYMHELQRAGYATDPRYADKVMSIYQGNTMAKIEPDVMVAMNQ